MNRLITFLVVVGALSASVWLGVRQFEEVQGPALPVAQAREGEFEVMVSCRGEIKAGRAAQIYAPFVPDLRISWTAPDGDLVQEGDPIIRFDASATEQELIEKQADLASSEATLAQAVKQVEITKKQDETSLKNARLAVEAAQLGTIGDEFLSKIEAEQKALELRAAKQELTVIQAKLNEHQVSGEAQIASLQRQRDLATAEVRLAKRRIEQMELHAPLTGYLILGTNYADQLNPQSFKVGDQVGAGTTLAVIPDLSSLMIDATLEETDRGKISLGDAVKVHVDALPELELDAKLTQVAPLAEFSLEDLGRSFRAYAELGNVDSRLRPGMNGSMDVIVERIPEAIIVPSRAVLTRNGRPVVYTVENDVPTAVEVEVLARNPDEIAIKGIEPDAMVSLMDPALVGEEGQGEGVAEEGAAPAE